MKVLFVLNTTAMGGGNISFINMMRGLHEKGIKCYIVSPDRIVDTTFQEYANGLVEHYYFAHLISHTRDDMRFYHGYRKFKKIVRNLLYCNPGSENYLTLRENKELDGIVREVKPDLIHTNVGVLQAGYQVAKKYHIPHVWHLREYQTKDFHWKIEPSYNRFIGMLHTSYVITITKDILRYFHLEDSKKAQCIYNGCFSREETSLELPKEKYFLCCSRVSEEKGHRDVVKAFSSFYHDHPEYKLVIAGFGPERFVRELEEMAVKGHCSDAVQFIGFQKDVKPLMRKAQALIVASRFEGFGRMTAEAAFCGCLVIGHNTGGTKEILDITGGFPYTGRADALEDKMREISALTDDQYKDMVCYAQKQAVDSFSNEAYVDQVYAVYQSILKNKKG